MESLARWLFPGTQEVPSFEWIWHAGGWTLYPILLLGLLAVPLSILTLIFVAVERNSSTGRVLPILLLALGLLPLGFGVLGSELSERQVREAILNVNPADAAVILEIGLHESQVPRRSGLLVGGPVLLLGGALTLLRFRRGAAPAAVPTER